jgi:hypothetical protein
MLNITHPRPTILFWRKETTLLYQHNYVSVYLLYVTTAMLFFTGKLPRCQWKLQVGFFSKLTNCCSYLEKKLRICFDGYFWVSFLLLLTSLLIARVNKWICMSQGKISSWLTISAWLHIISLMNGTYIELQTFHRQVVGLHTHFRIKTYNIGL